MPLVLKQPITDRERGALVALSRAGMGPSRLAATLQSGDPIDELSGSFGVEWRAMLSDLRRSSSRALVPSDDEYPELLRTIDAPPPLLYVSGEPLGGSLPCVGIVGARACTRGAARFAQRLGSAIASAGFTVVSGLARGIDAAAHRGALESGNTIAVLGTGLDVCYPAEHRNLAASITTRGALVTEFPPGLGPRAWHFPARNRIIAGLSRALIVVEAGLGSGALITVGFALDQGREVYACTTGPENPAGAGIRALLLDGASLIVDEEQAVDMLFDLVDASRPAHAPPVQRDPAARLSGEKRLVYEAIVEGSTADDVADLVEMPAGQVASVLAALELEGLVEAVGDRWERAESHR
jgi:DNA processing protein